MRGWMRTWTVGGTLVLASLMSSRTASAVPHIEFGDAGSLIGTHQNVGPGVDSIVGSLGFGSDVDLYRLVLPAGFFSASTGNAPVNSGADTQL